MKKNTTKTVPSPAPAKIEPSVPAKKLAAPAGKKKAAAVVAAPAPAPAPKAKVQASPAPAVKASAPAVKAAAPAAALTVVNAKIDIGFGNVLYLRGEGPGLSWDHGLPLSNSASDEWTLALPESANPVVFKFLINDLTWSIGADYVVAPGSSVTITPEF